MSIQDDIKRIQDEEERLQFERFDYDLAHRIGLALYEAAKEKSLGIAIDIQAYGQRLFHLAMAGTAPDNDRWIERKVAVVLRFHKSSLLVGRKLASEGMSVDERYFVDPRVYVPHGGAFPIRLKGAGVIGAATVSGLAQEEDHALVVSVLERFV
jgi:uncharacterized protein (UPF0303 family)